MLRAPCAPLWLRVPCPSLLPEELPRLSQGLSHFREFLPELIDLILLPLNLSFYVLGPPRRLPTPLPLAGLGCSHPLGLHLASLTHHRLPLGLSPAHPLGLHPASLTHHRSSLGMSTLGSFQHFPEGFLYLFLSLFSGCAAPARIPVPAPLFPIQLLPLGPGFLTRCLAATLLKLRGFLRSLRR